MIQYRLQIACEDIILFIREKQKKRRDKIVFAQDLKKTPQQIHYITEFLQCKEKYVQKLHFLPNIQKIIVNFV